MMKEGNSEKMPGMFKSKGARHVTGKAPGNYKAQAWHAVVHGIAKSQT